MREHRGPGQGRSIADNEGAKFWFSVMNELKIRGVQDVLIAVVGGLKGFPKAITAAFPQAAVQPGLRQFRAELVHWTNSTTPFTLHRASPSHACEHALSGSGCVTP